MNHAISAYSLSGYRQRMGAWNSLRIEHEQCPPFAWVMLVFAVAMTGGVGVTSWFESLAAGWIAGVTILALLGGLIDRRLSGAEALERRIRRRHQARNRAWSRAGLTRPARRPSLRWTTSAAPGWISTSACRRHPQPKTTARAG